MIHRNQEGKEEDQKITLKKSKKKRKKIMVLIMKHARNLQVNIKQNSQLCRLMSDPDIKKEDTTTILNHIKY